MEGLCILNFPKVGSINSYLILCHKMAVLPKVKVCTRVTSCFISDLLGWCMGWKGYKLCHCPNHFWAFLLELWHSNCVLLQEDTISINHNWLNGCNVDIMWQFLQNELLSVQKEIKEWRNTMDSWHQHCQVLNTVQHSCSKQTRSYVNL